MKLLLDSNVWVAAFGIRGLCQQLVERAIALDDSGAIELILCPAVRKEVIRVLDHKFRLTADEPARSEKVLDATAIVPDGGSQPGDDFPDPDDWPIVAAALEAQADIFVSGDKALLALGTVEALPVLDPRAAYLRLRGLG